MYTFTDLNYERMLNVHFAQSEHLFVYFEIHFHVVLRPPSYWVSLVQLGICHTLEITITVIFTNLF